MKIIDISGEKGETAQVEQTKKDTYREIRILRMCAGHPNISNEHIFFSLHAALKKSKIMYLYCAKRNHVNLKP